MLTRLGRTLPRYTSLGTRVSTPISVSLHTTAAMATSKDAVIPQADRMFAGNTHKLDVWSIFTYVRCAADLYRSQQSTLPPVDVTNGIAPPTSLLTASTSARDS